MIQGRIKAFQSRQKSHVDVRLRDLEFELGAKVFLKVSPMKGVVPFGKKGKLSPRYMGPHEILQKVGNVAYKMELPSSYPIFHVSTL